MDCNDCGGVVGQDGNVGWHLCAKCMAKRKRDSRMEFFEHICPPIYRNTISTKLPNQAAYEQVMDWEYGSQGLLIIGATGRGKSRSMWQLLKSLIMDEGLRPEVFDCVSFGRQIASRFQDPVEAVEWLEGLGKAKLVVFDDMGKLKMTERAETELFGIIEQRTANELPIIFTTQDTGDTMAAKMGDPLRADALVRRQREFCKVVTF